MRHGPYRGSIGTDIELFMRVKNSELLRDPATSDRQAIVRAPGDSSLHPLSLWLLLAGVGTLAALSGAIALATDSASGPVVLLVTIPGFVLASGAWRRAREFLDPAEQATSGTHAVPASSLPGSSKL